MKKNNKFTKTQLRLGRVLPAASAPGEGVKQEELDFLLEASIPARAKTGPKGRQTEKAAQPLPQEHETCREG